MKCFGRKSGRVLLLVLLATFFGRPALAQVDMTGLWRPLPRNQDGSGMIGDSAGDTQLLDLLGEGEIRKIPEDFALVVRTLILLNGLSHRLAPNRRLIQAGLLKHLAAGAARA